MLIVDDCYNASPVAMMASLDILMDAEGRKVAILGDMFELGEYGPSLHYEVGEYAVQKGIDNIVCIGGISENMFKGASKNKKDGVYYYKSLDDFFENGIKNILIKDSTVLIKASHSMQFEKIAKKLQGVK